MGWASTTLRLLWHRFTPPWLCDGLVLGTAVAALSSTSALAFASALRTSLGLPKEPAAAAAAAAARIYYGSCPECDALRWGNDFFNRPPSSYSSTLLEFSADSAITEATMSFTISFLIVTFALFLVRELR